MTVMRMPILLILTLITTACTQAPMRSGVLTADTHTSRLSLNWTGRYQGTLPCADCPGIDTEILLLNEENANGQGYAEITEFYRDRSSAPIVTPGQYEWSPDGRTLRLSAADREAIEFLVAENQLIRLDQDGNRIQGALADAYHLTQLHGLQALSGDQVPLTWQVTHLNGHAREGQAYIQFEAHGALRGFSGCNLFSGQLSLAGNQMNIHSLISTRKACSPTSIESELLTSLKQVSQFRQPTPDRLRLFDESGSLRLSLSAKR